MKRSTVRGIVYPLFLGALAAIQIGLGNSAAHAYIAAAIVVLALTHGED